MGIFDVAQSVITRAAGVIGGRTGIDVDAAIVAMDLESLGIPELLLLMIETFLVSFCMKIIKPRQDANKSGSVMNLDDLDDEDEYDGRNQYDDDSEDEESGDDDLPNEFEGSDEDGEYEE